MDRRDALKSLAALAGSTGMTVTPVNAKDAGDAVLVLLRIDDHVSQQGAEALAKSWRSAVQGTPLEGVRAIVMQKDVDVEIVRG